MVNGLSSVLAIDYGEKRVGLAIANLSARIPSAYKVLDNNEKLIEALKDIVNQENITNIIVGYPRGLDGQSTAQTAIVEEFASLLKKSVNLPLTFQDEALTSLVAENELKSRGKPYSKADIDALSATYILEDWLHDHAG